MDTLGERLAWARKKKGLNQTEVAEACGWKGHTRVSNYELGSEPENLDAIERLAAAVDVTPAWLAFGMEGGVQLSAEERRLLTAFRKAGDAQRTGVLLVLDPHGALDPGASQEGPHEPITEDMFGSATKEHARYEKGIVKAQNMSRAGLPIKKIAPKT